MRVGVIGTGAMGRNHARLYSKLGVLEGVFDLNGESADEIASQYGVERFKSVDDTLSKVDAVSICTPTSTHAEAARMAIDAGLSLLVEKPFTGDVNEAKRICELAEKEGVTLAVGMVERFNPVVEEARRKLDRGDFGDMVTISSRRVSSFPDRIRDVGVIMDLGIHDVDALTYMCNSRVESVFTIGGKFNGSGFEDHATIIMKMADGKEAIAEVNWLTPMKVRKVYMTCSKTYVQLDYMEQMISTSSSKYVGDGKDNLYESPWEFDYREIYLRKEEPLKRELENFIASVKGESKPMVTGRQALNNLAVCQAALRSMAENRQIDLRIDFCD